MTRYSKHDILNHLIPIILGVAAFFIVVGWQPLQFGNIAWLQRGDSAQHYLGWLFFRTTPWTFPLGANPNYGMDIGNSVFYSDSIPLFAFIFKPLSGLLPGTFQYFGLWFLLCFILQAWFAWRLIGLISEDTVVRACATGLFLFSPPMLFRVDDHQALAGHWLIVAGLYLYLAKNMQAKKWKWFSLAVVASLVHAYLLAMVAVLWISDTVTRLLRHEVKLQGLLYEYLIVIGGGVLSLWQAGYFLVKSGQITDGYGYYRMNLIALFNPSGGPDNSEVWSHILPSPALKEGDYDGFNYLGLGIIILLLVLSPCIIKQVRRIKFEPAWLPLLTVCLGLTLFAISNNMGIGSFDFTIRMPSTIIHAANILRACGRMFWPVYYLMLWGLLYLLFTNYGRKAVLVMLLGVLTVQAVDTSAGWGPIRKRHAVSGEKWEIPFKSPFWEVATAHYKKIRLIPPGNGPHYKEVAYLAATHGLPTDAAYLARLDTEKYLRLLDYDSTVLNTGNYERDTLYIIDASYVDAALRHLNAERDALAMVDGYAVVTPAWRYSEADRFSRP